MVVALAPAGKSSNHDNINSSKQPHGDELRTLMSCNVGELSQHTCDAVLEKGFVRFEVPGMAGVWAKCSPGFSNGAIPQRSAEVTIHRMRPIYG